MAFDLNEFADPAHSDADVRKILLDSMREVFREKGYQGEALENKIREKLSKPPSPKLVKIFKDMREIINYADTLIQNGYTGETLENKLREIVSKSPEEIQKIIQVSKK